MKVALVTGARGGVGPHVIRAFEAAGWTVAAAGREVDARDPAALADLVARVEGEHGGLDACVALAGGYCGGRPVADAGVDELRAMLEENLVTAFATAVAVVPALLRRGGGALVLVGARAAVEPAPRAAAYAAAKAGVVSLCRSLAEELRGTGVRVNCVLPGTIDTPANRAAMPGADVRAWVAPERLALVVRWLCSDEAADVRGAALPVFGRG